MQTVVIVIHLLVVMALVAVVLLQRSEGGALGIGGGGGGGGGGFMSARGAGNALTRITAGLAVAFFATSLTLSLIARYGDRPTDILDRLPPEIQQQEDGETGGDGILDELGGADDQAPPSSEDEDPESQVPTGQ